MHGSATNAADWGTPTQVTGYDSQSNDAIWMIPNKSTMDVTIRIGTGLVYRTSTYIYVGGGTPFSLLTWEEYTYDGHGHLTQRTASNGATSTYTWTKGQLTSTIGADGTETQFTYDEIGRTKKFGQKGCVHGRHE